jgi:hypothetical protein
MEHIFLALLINQAIIAIATEYLHFSDRFLWLRTYFSDICTIDNHPTGLKKGEKLVGSYRNTNRYIQEALSCRICLGKYLSMINAIIFAFVFSDICTGVFVGISCVLAGVINKKLFD